MSKACRIVSTILIVIGLGFLGYYFMEQSFKSKIDLLDMPSYYVVQNYKYVFIAGIFVLFFSVLGSFFSWFKTIENKEEVLPNAGYSSKEDISTWMEGTSLDTEYQTKEMPEHMDNSEGAQNEKNEADRTELLEQTEILTDEKTEILQDEQTEILVDTQEVQ